jgi:hypothetical protein
MYTRRAMKSPPGIPAAYTAQEARRVPAEASGEETMFPSM